MNSKLLVDMFYILWIYFIPIYFIQLRKYQYQTSFLVSDMVGYLHPNAIADALPHQAMPCHAMPCHAMPHPSLLALAIIALAISIAPRLSHHICLSNHIHSSHHDCQGHSSSFSGAARWHWWLVACGACTIPTYDTYLLTMTSHLHATDPSHDNLACIDLPKYLLSHCLLYFHFVPVPALHSHLFCSLPTRDSQYPSWCLPWPHCRHHTP